jgi:hypothetical protein
MLETDSHIHVTLSPDESRAVITGLGPGWYIAQQIALAYSGKIYYRYDEPFVVIALEPLLRD